MISIKAGRLSRFNFDDNENQHYHENQKISTITPIIGLMPHGDAGPRVLVSQHPKRPEYDDPSPGPYGDWYSYHEFQRL